MTTFFASIGLFFLFLIPFIAIFCLIFWIWMLIDCLQRENFKGEYDKILWFVVIILLNFLGAIMYFFVIKDKFDKSIQSNVSLEPTQKQTGKILNSPKKMSKKTTKKSTKVTKKKTTK